MPAETSAQEPVASEQSSEPGSARHLDAAHPSSPEFADSSSRGAGAEGCGWINILAFGLAVVSIPVGIMLVAAPLTALSAVVMGVMGVRAAREGDAGCAGLGYAAIVVGTIMLVAVAWVVGDASSSSTLAPLG